MKNINEVNKYIVAICLPFCTMAVIWGGVSLQEVKVRQSIMETKVDMIIPFVDMARNNKEDISVIKATLEMSKKSLDPSLVFTDPITFVGTEEKTIENLVQQDILIYY